MRPGTIARRREGIDIVGSMGYSSPQRANNIVEGRDAEDIHSRDNLRESDGGPGMRSEDEDSSMALSHEMRGNDPAAVAAGFVLFVAWARRQLRGTHLNRFDYSRIGSSLAAISLSERRARLEI
jgi:hypothetical protein